MGPPITSTDQVRKIALEYTIDGIPNATLQKYVDDGNTELTLRRQFALDVQNKVAGLEAAAQPQNYVAVGQLYAKK